MNISKPNWGLKPYINKSIYSSVIEKVILYACPIWYNHKIKFNLPSLHRTALIALTKCYRTVSTDALCVLAGCLPIDILIERENEYISAVSILVANNLCYNLNKKININIIQQKYLNYYIKDNKGFSFNNEFYTDGSKMNNEVSCAFVYYKHGMEVDSRKYRLSDKDMVFKAELLAIIKVVD